MWCKGFASFLPRQPVKAYFAREPTPNVDWGWVRTNCAHVDRAACEFAEALVPLLRILHGKMATADLDRVRLRSCPLKVRQSLYELTRQPRVPRLRDIVPRPQNRPRVQSKTEMGCAAGAALLVQYEPV